MSDLPAISSRTSPRFVKIVTIVTVLTICLFGSLVWHVWDTFRYLENTQKNYFRLTELSGQIVHLDEVLTMSARMAAATGEQNWEARYREFEAKLDAAIKEAMVLGQRFSLKDAADETDKANLKLVDMENKAFDLVRKGQNGKAAAILASAEYNLQKKIYITGITKITETIKDSMEKDLSQYSHRVYWAIGSILIVTPCLIFGWFLVIRLIRQYNANRTRVEEVLRESEEHFRNLFQNLHVIALVVDPVDGSIVDANPAASSFYGWSRDELLGMKITQINTLSREDISKEMDAALKQRRSHFLFQHRKADDTVRDVEVYSGPVRVGAKELLYSIIHDITDRKQAEEKLHKTSALLRIFMDAIKESAFLMDKEDRILAANETVAQRFNKTVQELIGSRIEDIFSREIVMKRRKYMDEVLETGKAVRFEDERMGRTIDNIIYPVIDPQGEVFALAIIGHDITERKRVEEELVEERRRLQQALDEVRTLRGIVPICANCKKIRDDKGYWNQVEVYVRDHTEAEFSHGICPDCAKELYPGK
jgi:PAS domain S-box-containing protein